MKKGIFRTLERMVLFVFSLVAFLILISPAFAAVRIDCATWIPSNIIAGSTYQINCTLENKESVERSFYVLFKVNETTGNYPIWKNDFSVTAAIDNTLLNCSESFLTPGTFSCFNGTEEYYLKPGKEFLYLNLTSNPALIPSNYSFSLLAVTSKIFASNENLIVNQTTRSTAAGLTTYSVLLNPTNTVQETNISIPIPNSEKVINLTLSILPHASKEIIALENELIIISPEETSVTNVSFSSVTSTVGRTTTTNQTLSLNVTGPSGETKEMWVYVNEYGEPDQIVVTLSTGDLIIGPDKWEYNDTTKIIKFNVTFTSPIIVNLFWVTKNRETAIGSGTIKYSAK